MTRNKNKLDYSLFEALMRWCLIIAAYYAGTRLGQLLILESHLASPVWPPSGIAIAALLRWGLRVSPALFIGALLASDWSSLSSMFVVVSALIKTLEPMAFVWLFRSFVPERYPFDSAKNVLIYCGIGLLVVFFSTTFNVGIMLSANLVESKNFGQTWYTWYLGNYSGAIIVAPLLLTWIHKNALKLYKTKLVELAILGLFLFSASLLVFGGWLPNPSDDYSLDHLLIPILLWIAYRFQIVGSTAAISLISIIAIWGTAHGHGPFVEQTAFESELLLQNFTLVITVTVLIFSAVLTERDRFEIELVKSEKRYHEFVSNSTEGIWRINFGQPMDCNLAVEDQIEWIFQHGHLSEANDVLANKWGLKSGKDIVGKRFSDIIPSKKPENLAALRRFVESDYKTRDLRTTGFGPDKSVRYFSTHATGHVENGRLQYIWAIITDITDKVHLEEARRTTRSQELKLIQANKMGALGVLISGVAHEINNPNNLVLLNAQTLANVWQDADKILYEHYREEPDNLLGGLPYVEMRGAVPELISDIADSSTRIKQIVENLKDFARPGAEPQVSDVDVNTAINRAIRLLKYFIQKKTHNFDTQFAQNLPTIKGDYQKIEQVIVNLLMNALEALPNTEHAVSVSTTLNEKNRCIEIRIRDDGVGIAKQDLDKVFDAFFTTKHAAGGTGLGLEISDMLIREHNGTISFDSDLGKGTEALVRLPY